MEVSLLEQLDAEIVACRACPRLVEWRERVAREKRAAYAHEDYWGRPASGFGDPNAGVMLLGLAPAAHGANRTGRVFTGDRSGDFLVAGLFRVGAANQPESVSVDDGLRLSDVRMVAAVRCAPPANAPTPAERDTCAPWLRREYDLLRPTLHTVVALGGFAWGAALDLLADRGTELQRPRPNFGHGVAVDCTDAVGPIRLLGCFHPSQQNTFTGRLTESMLDTVLAEALRRPART